MITQQSPSNVGATVDDINRRALELTAGIYTNPANWPYTRKLEEQIAGLNRLVQGDHDIGRIRWLISNQSPGGDWGVNRGGIDHLLGGLKDGKIIAGVVVLMANREVVNKCLVTDVVEKIKNARWLDLGRGEFVWVSQDFNLITRDYTNSRRYIVDPDAPM
jgi:hypothetical protein